MRSNQTAAARTEYEAAENERKRRVSEGLTFPSVRHAMNFLFERAPSMQSPLSHHPRGLVAADGSTVYLQIDCGGGGDIHEILTTLQSVHDALEALRQIDQVRHRLFVLHVRDGRTMVELGHVAKCSPATASREVSIAEGFLLGWLRSGGVILPAPVGAP